jgi:hypothetical protein
MRDEDICAEWQAKMAKAQLQPTTEIGGREYQRLAHAGATRCRDCAVRPGQLHVEQCCVERCPVCKVGQAISCSCHEAAEWWVQ